MRFAFALSLFAMTMIAKSTEYETLEKLIADTWHPHHVEVSWEPLFGDTLLLRELSDVRAVSEIEKVAHGMLTLILEGAAPSGELRRVTLKGNARVFGDAWTVNQRIKPGAQVSLESLESFRCEWTGLRDAALLDINAITGKLAVRPLIPGRVILDSDVKSKPLIRAGDSVTMNYVENGITIRITGVALKDGAPGDRIAIRVPDVEQKRLEGVVEDDATIRWVP
ncbi:flagellar basal body P-ring formation protein FlgA [bacterium]|nr:flagellar basal body P-ring formation protein FlgA [bacterium]